MFTDRDLRLFDVARSVAATSTHYLTSVGAVIVDGKDIVSVGVNGRKSHPLQAKYNSQRFVDDTADHLLHAELDAIIKAGALRKRLSRPSIYIYRLLRTGATSKARPCKGCMRAVKDSGITELYYTTDQGLVYERIDRNLLAA